MNFLFEFSRNHCVAICAFLVPASLLSTFCTIFLVIRPHPLFQAYWSAVITGLFASALLLHDFTWFNIGVVLAPTYILLALVCICLSLNVWAIAHPTSMKQLTKTWIPG